MEKLKCLEEIKKLRELRKNLRSLDVDGCSLLYPDGDEAARCRGDLGNDESTSGTDLAESLCGLHNLAPAMLEVLSMIQEGDAKDLSWVAEFFEADCEPEGDRIAAVIRRYEKMAALMEKEEQ